MARRGQIYDGDWIAPIKNRFQEECCGCGLVHDVDYTVQNKDGYDVEGFQVLFRCRINHRETVKSRIRNVKATARLRVAPGKRRKRRLG